MQSEIETLKEGFNTARRDYPAIVYLVICGKDTRLHKDQYRSKPLTKKQRTALIKKDVQVEADAIVQVQPKYEPTKDRIITEWEPELSDLGPEYYERHYLLAPKGNSWDKNNTLANLNALSSNMISLIIDDPAMRERLLPETYSSETQIGKWLAIARHLQCKDIPKLVFRLSDSGVRTAKDGEPYYSVVDDDVCLFSIKACDALIQGISEQHDAEKPAETEQVKMQLNESQGSPNDCLNKVSKQINEFIVGYPANKNKFCKHIEKVIRKAEEYGKYLRTEWQKAKEAKSTQYDEDKDKEKWFWWTAHTNDWMTGDCVYFANDECLDVQFYIEGKPKQDPLGYLSSMIWGCVGQDYEGLELLDYQFVLLSIIHDAQNWQAGRERIYFNPPEKETLSDRLCQAVWHRLEGFHNSYEFKDVQDTINTALRAVIAELAETKPEIEPQGVIDKHKAGKESGEDAEPPNLMAITIIPKYFDVTEKTLRRRTGEGKRFKNYPDIDSTMRLDTTVVVQYYARLTNS